MNRVRSIFLVICSLALGCFASTQRANAGIIYLNGAFISVVDSTTGANLNEPFEYDSFNTVAFDLYLNGVTGTPLLLSDGLNQISVTGQHPSYTGIGLFFTVNSALLDASSAPDFGSSPHLDVFNTAGGFATPVAGTSVGTLGAFSGNKPYSGLTSFTLGEETVTVTGWDGSTLDLVVTSSAPEPSTIAIFSAFAGLVIGGGMKKKVRREKLPKSYK